MIKNIGDVKSFLFENKGIKQTIFKNTFWITLSTAVGRIFGTLLVIYITRTLGATEYGKFAFALAFVSLFVSFLDLGVSKIVTRELSRDREREKEFSSIFSLRLFLGLGTIILIMIISFFVTTDPQIRKVIWILAFFTFISQLPEVLYAFFEARQRMEYISWARILQVLFVTGFGFFVVYKFPSVKNISYSYLFASLVAFIPVLLFFHFKIFSLKLSFQINIWRKFLKMSWPLALTSIFGLMYGYIDSVIMGYSGQITQAGWYNAALKIAILIYSPSSIIITVFYPVLSQFSKTSQEKFQNIWDQQIKTLILLALPAVVGSFILAPQIINFIYGSGYTPSIFAFQILIFMAGIMFIYTGFSQALIVADQQTKVFLITVSGAIINVILNLILIPKFSLYGAAIAAVITHFVMFILYFICVSQFTSIKAINFKVFLIFFQTILATTAMYLAISYSQIYYLNIFLSILIGAIIYLITFFTVKSALNYLTIKRNL